LAVLALVAPALAGAAELMVEAVQMPAWLERGGTRQPLAPGLALKSADRVVTGAGARALLRLADGSLIRLGENGALALDNVARERSAAKDLVTASLDVAAGAFRFTTQALRRFRGERDVRIRIVAVTAGIRGTDVWGKAAPDRDVLCLIEGAISVTHADKTFTMDQPKSFYIAPRDGPAKPVAAVSDEQLAQWAAEVEITPGAGAARPGGVWKVEVLAADTQAAALAAYDTLRTAGYAARIRPVAVEGAMSYRVQVPGLATRQDAAALAAKLKGRFGADEPKVVR
jgi:hypothetical protein